MSSIFITGATGFVGASLVRHFAGLGRPVIASGRAPAPPALSALASYCRADLCRPLLRQEAGTVVHAAALASDSAAPAALYAANVDGMRHVYEATRSSRVFVYISSSSVYDLTCRVHREDEPFDGRKLSAYGRSKRQAEDWLLQRDWQDRTLVILRPRAIYGPGDRVLLPRLMNLVRKGRIRIPGDMRVQVSLTHIGNLCRAVTACLDFFEKRPGGIHVFNVADPEPVDMRTVVGRLLSAIYRQELAFRELPLAPLNVAARLMGWLRVPTNFTAFALAAVSEANVLDCRKLAGTVGFRSTLGFESACQEIAHWVQRTGLEDVRSARHDLPWRR